MKKVLIFHQALAPYRIDFWNTLNRYFEINLFFMQRNLVNQKFNQILLREKLSLFANYHTRGFDIKSKIIRWGFKTYIKQLKPDIVFAYEFSLTTILVYFILKLYKDSFKLVITCDDNLEMAQSFSGYRKLFRNILINKIDFIIYTSESVADWYKTNFELKTDKTALVLPIIYQKENFQKSLKSTLEISNKYIKTHNLIDKKIFFYVGRFSEEKNLSLLIKAFDLVAKQNNEAILILIGDGSLKNDLILLTSSLGLQDRVLFVGRFEDKELMAWYNIGQIFILPSKFEPYGAVVGEALLSGARVICSEAAGANSLIEEGKNGRVFPSGNFLELSKLMFEESLYFPNISFINEVRPSNLFEDFEDRINIIIDILKST